MATPNRRPLMTFRDLERQVWQEAKEVFNNPKLRLKDILEWSTSKAAVMRNMKTGEVFAGVPCGCWVCVLTKHDKRQATKPTEGVNDV